MECFDATVSKAKPWTDDEYDEYIARLDHFGKFSVDNFTSEDFYSEGGTIYNKHFFKGSTFLFVVWITPFQPVMVYNQQVVEGYASREERDQEWECVWDCVYYRKTPENEDWRRSKVWKEVIAKIQVHAWWYYLGMY